MKPIEWKQEWPFILIAFLLPLIFFWNVFTNHSFGLDCAPSVMGNHEPYAQKWVGGNPFCSTSPDPGAYVWQHPPHWLEAMRDYTSGKFPLWTQNIGAGIPLEANFISTALFPPLLPFLFFFKISGNNVFYLDVFFLFRYMMLAGGMYLFLRTLGLSRIISFIGGLALFSTGYYITLPNIGHHNVDMMFPLYLFCVNMLFTTRRLKWVGWSALCSGISLLGAMPEVSAFLIFFTGLYTLLLTFVISKKRDFQFLGWTVISGVIGLAISSSLFVPGLEYIMNANSTHHVGDLVPKSLPFLNSINFIFPEIYVDPSVKQQLLDSGKIPFQLETWNYVGTILTFLFICAITYLIANLNKRKDRSHIQLLLFFEVFCLVMFVQEYSILHTYIFEHLPLFKETYFPKYSSTLINFTLITASCISLSEMLKKRSFSVVLAWVIFMAICLAVTIYMRHVFVDMPQFLKFHITNRNVLHGVFFATILTIAFLLVRWRGIVPYIICVCLIVEFFNYLPKGGYQGRYDTLRKPAAVSFLQSKHDTGHRIFATENILYPNNATIFDLNDMRMLDALWVRRYFEYIKAFFAEPYVQRITGLKETGASEPANILTNPYFDALSVKYIFSYSPLESLIFDKTSTINSVIKANPSLGLKNDMIMAENDTKSSLVMTQPKTVRIPLPKPKSSQYLILYLASSSSERISVQVRVLKENTLLASQQVNSTPSDSLRWRHLEVGPMSPDLAGTVDIELSLKSDEKSYPPVAWSGFYWDTEAKQFGETYHLIYNEEMRIYQNTKALPRIRFVKKIIPAAPVKKGEYQQLISAVGTLKESIRDTAIVESPSIKTTTFSPERATLTNPTYEDMKIAFKYTSSTPQYVVNSDTYYPGWNVYINGKKSTLDPVDIAFRGFSVPAGKDVPVELRYEPASFYIGSGISGIALVITFVFLINQGTIDESLLSLTLHKRKLKSTLR